MTEAEWLACEKPADMLHVMASGIDRAGVRIGSDRKLSLWLYAMAGLNPDVWEKAYAHLAAGGPTQSSGGLRRECESWSDTRNDAPGDPPLAARAALLRDIIGNPWRMVKLPLIGYGSRSPAHRGRFKICFMKCPWLTPDALSIATRIYDESDFAPDALGVLADALEEGGCDSQSILDHLRGEPCPWCKDARFDTGDYGGPLTGGPRMAQYIASQCACKGAKRLPSGPHVRGCWAVDLLLGKERQARRLRQE